MSHHQCLFGIFYESLSCVSITSYVLELRFILVLEFIKLLTLHDLACRLLEKEIIQLVTDPFTATLLRPKAIAYLFAYRKHAQPSREIVNNSNENNHINDATSNSSTYHLEIARAYNSFIRSWRQDLIDRNLLGGNVSSQRAANDSKLSFWLETIAQGI